MSLINHLWQSTLVAVLVAASTLAFRRNRAAVRHALWLAASIKFLVPFAALVAIGGALPFRVMQPAPAAHREVTIVVKSAAEVPPAAFGFSAPASMLAGTNAANALRRLAPAAIAVWIGGALLVAGAWAIRWRRVSAIMRRAVPIESGCELDALRAIERQTGHARPIALVSSDAPLEPGVFGILRPVLVWPRSIADHLGGDQIAAILAHEVSHVRRRDNLTAAMHMLVEALFWFHPLVWWIGARLVDERERACDEAVLQSGGEPEVYAASIVTACRVYVESPLACVAGVTGLDLSRRIERIMTGGDARALSLWRKALLAASALAVVAAPIAVGAAAPRPPVVQRRSQVMALRVDRPWMVDVTPESGAAQRRFEVASVRPNNSGAGPVRIETTPGGRFAATNVTVRDLIQFAYRLQPFQVSGGPDWLASDRFDIVATGDDVDADNFAAERDRKPAPTALMLRALLADRFLIALRQDTKEMATYALVVARPDRRLGPELRASTLDCSLDAVRKAQAAEKHASACGIRMSPGTMTVGGAAASQIARTLAAVLGRTVVDQTGLDGVFDATLRWTPDESTPGLFKKAAFIPAADPGGPSIFTALQEQLGLRLESQKAPVDVLVVDRAEHPIQN